MLFEKRAKEILCNAGLKDLELHESIITVLSVRKSADKWKHLKIWSLPTFPYSLVSILIDSQPVTNLLPVFQRTYHAMIYMILMCLPSLSITEIVSSQMELLQYQREHEMSTALSHDPLSVKVIHRGISYIHFRALFHTTECEANLETYLRFLRKTTATVFLTSSITVPRSTC